MAEDVKEVEEEAIDIEADEFLALHQGWVSQETRIGSDQGSLRKEIGDAWKDKNVHRKAMSHMRTGMKIKSEQGRILYFRTVQKLADDLLSHCIGQSTSEMDFDRDEDNG